MSHAINRGRLGQAGTTSLEFASVAVAFFMLLLGGTDLGRYFITVHSVRTVASEAARAALIDPTLTGCSTPVTRVGSSAPFIDSTQLSLCITQTTAANVTTITVNASYPFTFVLPALSSANGNVSETTQVSY